jgi:hypothetical protein
MANLTKYEMETVEIIMPENRQRRSIQGINP